MVDAFINGGAHMDVETMVALHEQKIESLERKLQKLEDISDGITKLQIAIEKTNNNVDKVVQSIELLNEQQKNHEGRLDAIERRPADKWDSLVKQVISLIVAALVGALLTGVIK